MDPLGGRVSLLSSTDIYHIKIKDIYMHTYLHTSSLMNLHTYFLTFLHAYDQSYELTYWHTFMYYSYVQTRK